MAVETPQLPQVVRQVKMVPETVLICPHCQKEIHEKGLYYDGTNWFHRSPECTGKPMAMPPPKENVAEILRGWGMER